MAWRRSTFLEALQGFLKEFDARGDSQHLALVWRSPDEYNVMDNWLLSHIKGSLSGDYLRVVLWLTRQEAAMLISVLRKEE